MNPLFLPAVNLILITIIVWTIMFVRRLSVATANNIDPQDMSTPEQVSSVLDAKTNAPANCFKNLFEMPVIFYALVAFISIAGTSDGLYLNLAWSFVILRAIQALVHCTYNRVMHRFYAYIASSLVLWVMVVRFFLNLI